MFEDDVLLKKAMLGANRLSEQQIADSRRPLTARFGEPAAQAPQESALGVVVVLPHNGSL